MVDVLPPRSRRFQRGVAGLVIGSVIVAIVVEIVRSSLSRRAEKPSPPSVVSSSFQERIANYMGETVCRECHPGESALHSRSGHARTLKRALQSPVTSWLDGRKVNDPEESGVAWSYHVRDGKLIVDRSIGEKIEPLVLNFAFGSSKHGVTFVAVDRGGDSGLDPSGIEHRLSYFAAGERLDITPGQEKTIEKQDGHETVSFGAAQSPSGLQKCFACHATVTSTLARHRLEINTLIPNVSCERCHGPGREHVEAARRGETELKMRMGHERAEPLVEVGLCGECHRLPRSVASSSIAPDNLAIVRFQGVGLSMSRCYSDGLRELRCTSCHDPHDRVSSDQAAYESVCFSCHREGSIQKACPISPGEKCISCHMPQRDVFGKGFFTDHWIRKPAPAQRDGADRPKTTASRPAATTR